MLLKVAGERRGRLVPWSQHDERFDDCAPEGIGLPYDGRLGDRRMLDQRRLYLERPDPV